MAASTLRRRAASSEPWCSAIGRLSSLTRHSSWNISSAWLRVLTNTRRELVRLDGGVDLGARRSGWCGRPRAAAARSRGCGCRAARRPRRRRGRRGGWCRRPAAARGRRAARSAAPPWPTGRCARGRARCACSRARSSASRSPRLVGASACSSSRITVLEAGEEARRVGVRQQQRHLLGRGQQDVGRAARAGAPCARPRCRRCASRRGSAGPSPRPGSSRLRATSTASALSGEM